MKKLILFLVSGFYLFSVQVMGQSIKAEGFSSLVRPLEWDPEFLVMAGMGFVDFNDTSRTKAYPLDLGFGFNNPLPLKKWSMTQFASLKISPLSENKGGDEQFLDLGLSSSFYYQLDRSLAFGPLIQFQWGPGSQYGSSISFLTTFVGASLAYTWSDYRSNKYTVDFAYLTDLGIPNDIVEIFAVRFAMSFDIQILKRKSIVEIENAPQTSFPRQFVAPEKVEQPTIRDKTIIENPTPIEDIFQ